MNYTEWKAEIGYTDCSITARVNEGKSVTGIATLPKHEDGSQITNAHLIVAAVNACVALDNEQPLMVSYFIRDSIDTLRGLYENYKRRLQKDDKGQGLG